MRSVGQSAPAGRSIRGGDHAAHVGDLLDVSQRYGISWLPYQRNVIFKAVSSLRFPPCCRLKGGTESSISVMAVYMHNCGAGWPAPPPAGTSMSRNISSVLSPRPAAYRSTPKRAALDRMGRSCPARESGRPTSIPLQVGLELGQHGGPG